MTASGEKHADLWDKVDEAYFDLPDDYDFDNYDEAAFIRSPELPDRRGKGRADRRLQPSYGDRQPAVRAVHIPSGATPAAKAASAPFDGKAVF